MKQKILNILCVIVLLSIVGISMYGIVNIRKEKGNKDHDAPITSEQKREQNINRDVEIDFSDIILSEGNETRKLIVSEQNATVSAQLTDRVIKQLHFDFLTKTQKVNYNGKGYFIVDLDALTKANISQSKFDKTVTIKINHAHLQNVEINPNDIIIEEVQEGLFARGDIELTLQDYNALEKDLQGKLETALNTEENRKQADDNAVKMVQKVYEPIIQAIDRNYRVEVVIQ